MDTEVSKALQVAWRMPECRETGDRKGDRKKETHIHRKQERERRGEREGGKEGGKEREKKRERERQAEGDNAERNQEPETEKGRESEWQTQTELRRQRQGDMQKETTRGWEPPCLPLASPKPTSPEKDLHRPLKKRLPTAPNPREAGSDTLPPKPAALVSRAPVTPQALLHGSKLRVQGPGPIPSGKTR